MWRAGTIVKVKKGNLPFFMLVVLLADEVDMININLHLIGEHHLKRHQRSKYWQLQADIFKA
jgi:hypothetical protein